MTGQNDSQWQTQKLSQTYLDGVRRAIPLAQEQIEVMLKVASAWQPNPEMVLDLGCGDGILGRAVLERAPDAHVVFVDFSAPMLEATREKIPPGASVRILQSDFSSLDWQAGLDGGIGS